MLETLERFKKGHYYSVTLYYGEGTGCDDSDVPMLERKVRLFGVPVGVLGSARVAWVGKVKDFDNFDFNQKPVVFDNPPNNEQNKMMSVGDEIIWAVWGTHDSVERVFEIWDEIRGIKRENF